MNWLEPPIHNNTWIELSNYCNPDFIDNDGWNCTLNYDNGECDYGLENALEYSNYIWSGRETLFSCPECGCIDHPFFPDTSNLARSDRGNHHDRD